MLIDSTVAGRICNVTPSFLTRCFRALGVKPDKREGRGPGGTCFWGARHLLALLLVPVLERIGCRSDNAEQVAQGVALSFTSDEHAEAVFEGGRRYLMVAGNHAAPELFRLESIQNVQREYAAGLAEMRITLLSVDLLELWNEIRRAARAAAANGEEAHQSAE